MASNPENVLSVGAAKHLKVTRGCISNWVWNHKIMKSWGSTLRMDVLLIPSLSGRNIHNLRGIHIQPLTR